MINAFDGLAINDFRSQIATKVLLCYKRKQALALWQNLR